MKLVKKFACAVLLVSALAVPTFAGDMETPGYVAPPPPPSSSMTSTTTTDDTTTTTTGVTDPAVSGDTVISSDLLYDAFMAVIALF